MLIEEVRQDVFGKMCGEQHEQAQGKDIPEVEHCFMDMQRSRIASHHHCLGIRVDHVNLVTFFQSIPDEIVFIQNFDMTFKRCRTPWVSLRAIKHFLQL